jgi:hypothetical protein
MGAAQELDPGHALEPLAGEQQRDLLAGLAERRQGRRWSVRRDDLVVRAEPPLKRLRRRRQRAWIVRHDHQRRLGHDAPPAPPSPGLPGWPGRRPLDQGLIGVAPQPVLARLHRADDLVGGGVLVSVAASVLVLGRVAAQHLPVGHAHAQMDPGVPKVQARLAAR